MAQQEYNKFIYRGYCVKCPWKNPDSTDKRAATIGVANHSVREDHNHVGMGRVHVTNKPACDCGWRHEKA